MAQFMRPNADTFNGGFLRENGNSVNIFQAMDDTSQNDTDYIQSSLNPSNQVFVCKLSGVVDPGIDTGHIVRLAGGKNAVGGRKIDITFELRQGYVSEASPGTLCGSQPFLDVAPATTPPFPLFEAEISSAVIANITNYNDLYMRIIVNTQP